MTEMLCTLAGLISPCALKYWQVLRSFKVIHKSDGVTYAEYNNDLI